VLSWASSTGSGEAPLQPLMAPPLHSNAQSYTSLSSLGNASDLGKTDKVNRDREIRQRFFLFFWP